MTFHLFTESKTIQDAWLTIDISGPFDADSAETFLVWEVIFRPAVNGVVARVVFI